ncbi:hypothetical protein B9Z55_027566 [Caenorhabditis nigoni]|uniref:Uncharacterized protein n=1 Tax=Caenorhabditis nigoni TaxID=1611254 RepID=A0A2G5SFN7_9PELO|nr:hypothetical protein B9Z55_027566 [Caenorhabditis nigoni]
MKIDNKSPILEMVPPIENVGNPKIEVTVCRNLTENIIDAVRVTEDDGTEGWLKIVLGGCISAFFFCKTIINILILQFQIDFYSIKRIFENSIHSLARSY